MRQISVDELIDFILTNRGEKVFKGKTRQQILIMIIDAIKESAMSYSCDDEGKLNGVAIGRLDKKNKVFFVQEVLASEGAKKGVLGALLIKFYEIFPDYKLHAMRRGKIHHYKNIISFISKVIHFTNRGII
jgi:hypothetical protein